MTSNEVFIKRFFGTATVGAAEIRKNLRSDGAVGVSPRTGQEFSGGASWNTPYSGRCFRC